MIIAFDSCTVENNEINNPSGMTPEETVERYFEYWQDKNSKGIDSLVYKSMQGVNYEMERLNSITLNSCEERTEKIEWYQPWYPNPYDNTCVDVSFTTDYEGGCGSGHVNGIQEVQYYLVKETDDSDWIIVMWGVG